MELQNHFNIKPLGDAKLILGLQVRRNKYNIAVDQAQYVHYPDHM